MRCNRRRSSPIAEEIFNNDNWRIRRRVMFLALAWLGTNVQYLLIKGADTALNQQTVIAMLVAISSIIGCYVFGAVWDDNNKMNQFGNYPPEYFKQDFPPTLPPDEEP